MKKFASLMLMPLALMLVGQRCAHADPLTVLGVAGQYNVFVVGEHSAAHPIGGDLILTHTDVEGRAAARGDVTLTNFAIGSRVSDEQGISSLVAGKAADLNTGSVGCLTGTPVACPNPQLGTVVYGTTLSVTGVGSALPAVPPPPPPNPSYINFAAAQSYVNELSTLWGGLAPTIGNSTTAVSGLITLTGHNPTQNIFSVNATDLDPGFLTVDFVFDPVAIGSTVLVNVTGNLGTLHLMNMSFNFNGIPGESPNPPPAGQVYSHSAGFPYSNIIFNFPDETGTIALDHLGFNGSLFAPFADVTFTTESHIDGNVVAYSLSGSGESHAIPFVGTIFAVPEPATLLLVAGGLIGMGAWRRRK